MTKSKYYVSEKTVRALGRDVLAIRVNNDINGNPRWAVHFSELGLERSEFNNVYLFEKYRANWFGGAYIFQSHNIQHTLENALKKIEEERDSSYKVYNHKNKIVHHGNQFYNALAVFKRQQGHNRSFKVIQGKLQTEEAFKQRQKQFYNKAFKGVK